MNKKLKNVIFILTILIFISFGLLIIVLFLVPPKNTPIVCCINYIPPSFGFTPIYVNGSIIAQIYNSGAVPLNISKFSFFIVQYYLSNSTPTRLVIKCTINSSGIINPGEIKDLTVNCGNISLSQQYFYSLILDYYGITESALIV